MRCRLQLIHPLKKWSLRQIRDGSEGLDRGGLEKVIDNYLFTGKTPLPVDVIRTMDKQPRLRERRTVGEHIIGRIVSYVDTFIDGVD